MVCRCNFYLTLEMGNKFQQVSKLVDLPFPPFADLFFCDPPFTEGYPDIRVLNVAWSCVYERFEVRLYPIKAAMMQAAAKRGDYYAWLLEQGWIVEG
jgi:hypothetical protein